MEKTLFAFIWKHSRRQQLMLLIFSLISFPFLYVSLELPKRIINDAIGSPTDRVGVLGYDLTQIEFLMVLCFAYLATVLVSGLMKMRINTMKGVLAERMLRRLRYTLISRMMRFPKPYFRSTSQGELVSMITSEAEPMGGLMGDAIAQPVFQFGQMMTIVVFLFAQSVWFGLASVALIPLQAWVIPMLQRQINLLNKSRIKEIRSLSSEIGESAAGISDLRANGGWRFRQALFSDRLGRLFDIRYMIYRKKYFMKFINNMITHMTPFLYYSFGGILAIRGDISIGALVAALGAYKDLSSPWKALLLYYNQVQDMSLRWEIVTERFAPSDMIDKALIDGNPGEIPHLKGTIEFRNVCVEDQDGNIILEDLNLTIPPGARVAIQSNRASERAALGQLLTRELLPSHGEVILSGHPLKGMHQAVIAARVGYAHSRPYLFDGTLGGNLLMPLRPKPQTPTNSKDAKVLEAIKSGNSTDSPDAHWLDPGLAGLNHSDEIRAWWFELVEAMGLDEIMVRRTLNSQFDPKRHPKLAERVVGLRDEVFERLKAKGLDEVIHRFDPDTFNPSVPLGGNLLFAAPSEDIPPEDVAHEHRFVRMLYEHRLADEAIEISQAVIETLTQTFGKDGIDHPLFRRLGLEEETYLRLAEIARKREKLGEAALSDDEEALMLIVPLTLSAEQIGPSFPERFKEEILEIRKSHAAELRKSVGDRFTAIAPDVYLERLTVIENAIYGRVSIMAGARADEIEDLVAEVFAEQGLRRRMAATIYDLPTGLGGAKLPTVFQERAAFSRASIKRPDILILDKALSSHDSQSRLRTRQKLRNLLPESIMIFLESKFEYPDAYDLFVEIKDGRVDGIERREVGRDVDGAGEVGTTDLSRKLAIIANAPLFAGLDARNQRLLAFSAHWYEAEPGQVIFANDQIADAAYLCVTGRAELRWPNAPAREALSVIGPGQLIGDLAVISNKARTFDLVATEATTFLRIGAEEFRSVIEHDAAVAVSLLQSVVGHLSGAAELLQVPEDSVHSKLSEDQEVLPPPSGDT